LLHSDTAEGKLCAEVCKNALLSSIEISGRATRFLPFLENKIEIVCIEKLKMDDPKLFAAEGMKNLREIIEKKMEDVNPDYYLNITGGYKGAIPFLTALAAEIKRKRVIKLAYLFEDSPQILIADAFDLTSLCKGVLGQ
jgi:CRISPR/Cas system-associated protein Csm6